MQVFTDGAPLQQMPRTYRKLRRRRSRRFSRRAGRRTLRRSFRRGGRRRQTGGIRRGAITTPVVLLRKFRYRANTTRRFNIGPTVDNIYTAFNMNSLFQPDQSAAGPENIPGMTEMGQLYERGKVQAVKVKIKYQPTLVNTTLVENQDNAHLSFVVLNEGATLTPSWANWESYIANNPQNIIDKFIGATQQSQSWGMMSKYFKLKNFATTPASFEADDAYINVYPANGRPTVNPTRLIQGYLVVTSPTSTGFRSAYALDLMVEWIFYVRFTKRRLQLA